MTGGSDTGREVTGGPERSSSVRKDRLGDDRYELGELLGAGGMGLVRRATDTVLDRQVAVKLLADNLSADSDARTRFEREARSAAQISHPNVVQVFDVGEDGGRPYLVMELIDGESLGDALRRDGPLDPHDVVDVATQALAGLARAHDAGLMHRDLKPANLMRGSDGVVKVTDFGVAQAAEQPGLTRTGLVIGTHSYLAPERRRGAPASVVTDLYALGATLLELLTGRPPAEPGPDGHGGHSPQDMGSEVPEGLALLVRACLADDPAERPASAELALELLATGRLDAIDARDAEAHAATVPAAATSAVGGRGDGGTLELEEDDQWVPARSSGPTSTTGGRRVPMPVLVGIGALVLLVLALFFVGDPGRPGDGGAEQPADQPARSGAVDPVPQGEDPADTARNLADWLRDNSGP